MTPLQPNNVWDDWSDEESEEEKKRFEDVLLNLRILAILKCSIQENNFTIKN